MTLFTGATVEEAIERGLKLLNTQRENVHIEIEQHDSKGVLGFGKKRARVDIVPIDEKTVRQAEHQATKGLDLSDLGGLPKGKSALEATLELHNFAKQVKEAEEAQAAGETILTESVEAPDALTAEEPEPEFAPEVPVRAVAAPAAEVRLPRQAPAALTSDESRVSDAIATYLEAVTRGMGIETEITFHKVERLVVFEMKSHQDALLIGKHGKVLQALTMLAKAYSGVLSQERINVAVNVGEYYEKRKRYIANLARHAAEQVKNGETVYINDLQASERKIVHNIIGGIPGLSSHSEGSENNRYIVVSKDI